MSDLQQQVKDVANCRKRLRAAAKTEAEKEAALWQTPAYLESEKATALARAISSELAVLEDKLRMAVLDYYNVTAIQIPLEQLPRLRVKFRTVVQSEDDEVLAWARENAKYMVVTSVDRKQFNKAAIAADGEGFPCIIYEDPYAELPSDLTAFETRESESADVPVDETAPL